MRWDDEIVVGCRWYCCEIKFELVSGEFWCLSRTQELVLFIVFSHDVRHPPSWWKMMANYLTLSSYVGTSIIIVRTLISSLYCQYYSYYVCSLLLQPITIKHGHETNQEGFQLYRPYSFFVITSRRTNNHYTIEIGVGRLEYQGHAIWCLHSNVGDSNRK